MTLYIQETVERLPSTAETGPSDSPEGARRGSEEGGLPPPAGHGGTGELGPRHHLGHTSSHFLVLIFIIFSSLSANRIEIINIATVSDYVTGIKEYICPAQPGKLSTATALQRKVRRLLVNNIFTVLR